MGLLLKSVDDPRDKLEKARWRELYMFAKQNGLDIPESMPAILIRRELRAKGLTNIQIPNYRQLGRPDPHPSLLNSRGQALTTADQAVPDKGGEANADDDLARQFREQSRAKAEAPKPVPPANDKRAAWKSMKLADMGINDLRWACKANDIALTRKTNMPEMRKLLAEKGLK